MLVKNVMTKNPITITPECSVTEAKALMNKKNIGKLPVVDKNFKLVGMLTKGDIEKMQQEIKQRKEVTRWELLEAVKTARAQGDLSENFEYYAAKREKNRNESRIRYLERMIKTAHIIDDLAQEDEVGLNNKVTVRIEEDQTEETYRIVTTVRGDVLDGLISNVSPVGKALLGHKVGDTVTVKVSDDYSYDMTVIKIEKTNDESADQIKSY